MKLPPEDEILAVIAVNAGTASARLPLLMGKAVTPERIRAIELAAFRFGWRSAVACAAVPHPEPQCRSDLHIVGANGSCPCGRYEGGLST